MTREQVNRWAEAAEVELLCADGFDDAILGIGQRFNDYFVVYDHVKVLATLIARDGMTVEEAEEWFGINIVGAWVGECTPCFLMTNLD